MQAFFPDINPTAWMLATRASENLAPFPSSPTMKRITAKAVPPPELLGVWFFQRFLRSPLP